jgi:hypothetical protein
MSVFICFQCGRTFEDDDSCIECCVGGHWTPHKTEDRPTGTYPVSCCHQYQKEIKQSEEE